MDHGALVEWDLHRKNMNGRVRHVNYKAPNTESA